MEVGGWGGEYSVSNQPFCRKKTYIDYNSQFTQHPDSKIYPFDPSDHKLSSSKVRFNQLGDLLKPVSSNNNHQITSPFSPYMIGLTGPAGSGKSSLAKRLAKLSEQIHIIDCDRLGHEAYV
ncbi:unnamed protein product [Trichobilharzia regenti]|nr:unnamed protein product [Trichobilharzia regenti]